MWSAGCERSVVSLPPPTLTPLRSLLIYIVSVLNRNDCRVVLIEAEDIPLAAPWRVVDDGSASGGQYIVWEGLESEQNNFAAEDGNPISYDFQVTYPGTYNFRWSMRQEPDVEGDKANDSWLNFPDADRFGPKGRTTSYGGYVKVYGNSEDIFRFVAYAEPDGQSASSIQVKFDEVGVYTMEISGRSHGHQIDQILMWETSLPFKDAKNGC